MWFNCCWFLLIQTLLVTDVQSVNILGIFPHPGKSHFDVFEPLMMRLAEVGHDVTVISFFPKQNAPSRYTDIDMTGTTPIITNSLDMDMLVNQTRMSSYLAVNFLIPYAAEICNTLASKQVQDFLKSDTKFDLVIVELFATNCYLSLLHKVKAPFIFISSCAMVPWASQNFGNIDNPAYIPTLFMDFAPKMDFFQRVENSIVYVVNLILYQAMLEAPGNDIVSQYISADVPLVEETARNASLLLVNSHFTLFGARPLVPNIIEVGGIHIKDRKPLPQNIEKFISDAPHGAIYFSMGSMIKAHTFPDDKRDAFLGAFGKLRQRVLWKWENDSMPGKPDNVLIQSWLPQYDILCHSNVVAFISHGGLLGTTEAVHCGVPILVIPQFGDQFTNAKAIEANGGGVILQFSDITEETVLKALNTVLDPSFRKQAKTLSAEFRDRPLSPMDTAIYWVEYVARHGGAPRMRSAAVDMPFYQYLLLDVIAFVLAVLTLMLVILYRLVGFILGLMFSNKKEKLKAN